MAPEIARQLDLAQAQRGNTCLGLRGACTRAAHSAIRNFKIRSDTAIRQARTPRLSVEHLHAAVQGSAALFLPGSCASISPYLPITAVADILNISCYKFTPLPDADQWRDRLAALCAQLDLKGTILLAEEGINFFLAGPAEAVHALVDDLRSDERFADLQPKESWSETVPFRKMLVKVKNEIIRMNHPSIRPANGRAPSVSPAVLRRWLEQGHDDEGREVVTLDTRNDFEVDAGAFRNAIDWRITKFTEFPPALLSHKQALEGKTVVSYCTGGIRCEKAAILMQDQGIENVYQLEGGILKYFEETDGAFYDGGCFVFDQREALGTDLSITPLVEEVAVKRRKASAPESD